MANNADTQAFLDEAKTPSVQTLGTAQSGALAYRPVGGATKRQFGLHRDNLTGAVIAEEDDALRQKLVEVQAAAIECETAVDGMMELMEVAISAGKRFNQRYQEAVTLAAALGYTT